MRELLAPLGGQRRRFIATFGRTGARPTVPGHTEPTVLLAAPALDAAPSDVLCDHLWMTYTRGLAALGPLEPGARLAFDARVTAYRRRHGGIEYGLSRPTRVALLPALPTPEPLPTPAAETPPPALPARVRILAALTGLCAEQPEPPSMKRLYAAVPMPPLTFLQALGRLAGAGAITFSPCGRILLATATEGSLSC